MFITSRYNVDNIFYKIITGSHECNKFYEDNELIIFEDIYPKAKVHLLCVPKLGVVDFVDFTNNSTPEQVSYFFNTISNFAQDFIKNNTHGLVSFKLATNNGSKADQVVFHLHFHLMFF